MSARASWLAFVDATREGLVLNHKKLRWLSWERQGRLQVRRRGDRKRVPGTWIPRVLRRNPNLPVGCVRTMVSASSPWSTTSGASALRRWRTLHCRGCGSRANSTQSSPRALPGHGRLRQRYRADQHDDAGRGSARSNVTTSDGAPRSTEGSAPRPVASPSQQGSN